MVLGEYANDLCLLAPSRGSISFMLNTCEQFCAEYDVLFNSQKSHLVQISTSNRYEDMPPLSLNGEWLKLQEVAKHFGHTIGNNSIYNIALSNEMLCGKQIM